MGRWIILFRRTPAWFSVEQHASLLIKQHLSLTSASSSSSPEDNRPAGQGQEKDLAEPQPGRPGKAAAWTPGRRRALLSPSARLFAALNEESSESERTTEQAQQQNPASDSEDKLYDTTVQHFATDCDPHPPLPKDGNGDREELSQSISEEKVKKEHNYEPRLRRRNLSPLKRFSSMIPENYWNDSKDGSSVKQDLDSLMKSDDSLKK